MRVQKIAGLLVGATIFAFYGCGGGGAAGGGGASLGGQVVAPDSQTRAAHVISRAADPLVPVSGATITVHDLTTDQDVATDITKSDGHYLISGLTAGHNYEITITKTVPAGTLTLKAVVTPDAGTNNKDVNPDTTVAAVAVEVKITGHPELKHSHLGDVAKDIEDQHPAATPPDLTNHDAEQSAGQNAISAVAPRGTYIGAYSGDQNGTLFARFEDGKFLLCEFPAAADGKPVRVSFAKGTVDSAGNVSGTSTDGSVTLSGTFSAGVGSGTYQTTDGKSGTWTLKQAAHDYAGLYQGGFHIDSSTTSGLFVLAINEDKSAWAFGTAQTDNLQSGDIKVMTGTLADDNTLSLTGTMTLNGQDVTKTMTGTLNPAEKSAHGTITAPGGFAMLWSVHKPGGIEDHPVEGEDTPNPTSPSTGGDSSTPPPPPPAPSA